MFFFIFQNKSLKTDDFQKPCLRLATTGAKKTIKLKSQADLKHPDTRFGYEARCSAIDTLSETVIVGDERGNVHWWTKET